MNITERLSFPEILYLRKFFDGVDHAVAQEMASKEVAYEEFLTPMFGRLLDGRSPFQAILPYKLRDLNHDLSECGSVNALTVEFETNEHAKGFSGTTSHCDLGIIFRRENPLTGRRVEKGLLVECKRLYPIKRKYSIACRYEGFDISQYAHLNKLASNNGWQGVCYFLYNPTVTSFEDHATIKAIELQLLGALYPVDEDLLHYLYRRGLDVPYRFYGLASQYWPVGIQTADPQIAGQQAAALIAKRPGLRVLGVTSLHRIVGSPEKASPSRFTLSECYRYAADNEWTGTSGAVPFVSLASFLVDFLMGCVRGSTAPAILSLAAGKNPSAQGEPRQEEAGGNLLAKHTLRLTVRSVLPETTAILRTE